MAITLGTLDGVWSADERGAERIGLAGRWVSHVASDGVRVLAAVAKDGLYELRGGGEQRIWAGDARSCAIAPDGAGYVGAEPAMVYRRDKGGGDWLRSDAIDALPTRGQWTFPPPPHQPHVLSIDFLPDQPTSVLAGIEVGGVLLSRDRGVTWSELNRGVYVDVHAVRPDPTTPGRLVAVTGRGVYISEDGGASWQRRMHGIDRGYTMGVSIHPRRAGELLVTAGDRPPGLNGRIYHSSDAGLHWHEVRGAGLPSETTRASVPLFTEDAAWIATDAGALLRASEPRGSWTLVHTLPACINAVAAGGSPSSVMH